MQLVVLKLTQILTCKISTFTVEWIVDGLDGMSMSSMSVKTTISAQGFTKNKQFTWDSSIPAIFSGSVSKIIEAITF